MFDRLAALPADLWNWDDRRAGPTLADGQARVPGGVCGGLDQWGTLKDGTAERAQAEAQDAVAQAGGRGLVLGAGCVILPETPDATMIKLITSVGGRPRLGLFRPQL
jgi:uroporphyrinogen decarboxylase